MKKWKTGLVYVFICCGICFISTIANLQKEKLDQSVGGNMAMGENGSITTTCFPQKDE
jgi:hypothetical protein